MKTKDGDLVLDVKKNTLLQQFLAMHSSNVENGESIFYEVDVEKKKSD